METAIKKAIESGWQWKPLRGTFSEFIKRMDEDVFLHQTFLLDPLFWQAVGKACGWTTRGYMLPEHAVTEFGLHGGIMETVREFKNGDEWKYWWHRFIDHLAEGKSPDEFFNQLLK